MLDHSAEYVKRSTSRLQLQLYFVWLIQIIMKTTAATNFPFVSVVHVTDAVRAGSGYWLENWRSFGQRGDWCNAKGIHWRTFCQNALGLKVSLSPSVYSADYTLAVFLMLRDILRLAFHPLNYRLQIQYCSSKELKCATDEFLCCTVSNFLSHKQMTFINLVQNNVRKI
jgi:hypothetical protein